MIIPHARVRVDPDAVDRVIGLLTAGSLSTGDEVATLEQDLRKRFHVYAAAVSSGSAALFLALRALGIGRGDRVAIPALTCNSVRAAVELAGAVPVPVDSRPDGLTLDPGQVSRCAGENGGIAAVVAPHQFGFEADIDALLSPGVPVIEDCAHAPLVPGADGRILGRRGTAGILSFFATKWLAAGEGGCVISRDDGIIARVRALRNPDVEDPAAGAFNFKLSDIHAALARVHLRTLQERIEVRRRIAARFDAVLAPWALHKTPGFREFQACVFRYLLFLPGRAAEVIRAAEEAGITCRRPLRIPLHRYVGGACPRADFLFDGLISVPCFPGMSEEEVEYICSRLPGILSRL